MTLLKKNDIHLTIGTFDGVHLGHQAILNALGGHRVAITFANHPQTILSHQAPPLLMFTNHRLSLLKTYVDEVIELTFTEALSHLSAQDFLITIRKQHPFTHLILGYDAVLGYRREGTASRITQLSKEMGFNISYLPPLLVDGEAVSSSRIRAELMRCNLTTVARLLGRTYTIRGCVMEGQRLGKTIGYPTANISVSELALPPFGVYATTIQFPPKQGRFKAIANLGIAPTLHTHRGALLEVHLLEEGGVDLYGRELEVSFLEFFRPEKKFSSIDALRAQIQKDIQRRLSMKE